MDAASFHAHRNWQVLEQAVGREHVREVSCLWLCLWCFRKGHSGSKRNKPPLFALGAKVQGAGSYGSVRRAEGSDQIIKINCSDFSKADSSELDWLSEAYLSNDKW